jgi:exodeoxyribonuclease VII small subunit
MSRKKPEEPSPKGDEPSFEKALSRLETIVAEMEGGALSLEDMMARFEEGQRLVKVCGAKLNQVERRIELLVKEGDIVKTAPFGDEDEAGPAAESGDEAPGPGGLPF